MPRSVVLSTENVVNLPAITPDPLVALVEDEGAQSNALPSSYEGNNFSIVLVFDVKYTDDLGTVLGTLPADNIYITYDFGYYGLTGIKTSNNKFTINGTSGNIFPGSYYEFTMPDMSVQILPPNTAEEFKALTLYNMPVPTAPVQLIYPFQVNARDDFLVPGVNSNVSSNVQQWFAWSYQSAVTTVKDLVAEGQV